MKAVYGPVSSWRLGRSLGIDPICSEKKVCPFSCIYCQLGSNEPRFEQKEFISLDKLKQDLSLVKDDAGADVVTFSGTGEPTMASNLNEMVGIIRARFNLPVAVLTNCTYLSSENVKKTLLKADIIVAKLDAPNEEIFQRMNRPHKSIHFDEYLENIKTFRRRYSGKFALQIMFTEVNKDYAKQLAEIAEELEPDEIQINTPLRPCTVKPLSREEIEAIKDTFKNFKSVKSVYDAEKPRVDPIDLDEVKKRKRPKP